MYKSALSTFLGNFTFLSTFKSTFFQLFRTQNLYECLWLWYVADCSVNDFVTASQSNFRPRVTPIVGQKPSAFTPVSLHQVSVTHVSATRLPYNLGHRRDNIVTSSSYLSFDQFLCVSFSGFVSIVFQLDPH